MKRFSLVHYNQILNSINSISDSTNKEFILKNEHYKFSGVNSPYISRQFVEITYGHGLRNLIIFKNDYKHLIIHKNPYLKLRIDENVDCHIIHVEFPSFYFKNILKDYRIPAPKWLVNYPLVNVLYIDRFQEFDEDGNSQYYTGSITLDLQDSRDDRFWYSFII